MSRLRAEMDLAHKGQRDQLWQRQQRVRTELGDNTQAAADHARGYVRAQFRPRWKNLYRAQRSECKFLANATLLERAVFVFSRRERLGLRKPLSLRQAISLIRSPGKLLNRIEAVHSANEEVWRGRKRSKRKSTPTGSGPSTAPRSIDSSRSKPQSARRYAKTSLHGRVA